MFEPGKSTVRGNVVPRTIRRQSSLLVDRFHGWQAGLPPYVKANTSELPTIISVGGGKGGVGKSIFSANFSARLGQMGYRVLAIDMDLGCSNLHTHFGIAMPKKSLADFVISSKMSFQETINSSVIPNVGVIPCGREEIWAEYLEQDKGRLLPLWDAIFNCRKRQNVDFVVLDLGAGTSRLTVDFFNAAHLGVITVLPEPTSIENAYVFIKTMLWNLLDNVGVRLGQEDAIKEVRASMLQSGGSFNNGYAECLRKMAAVYPDLIGLMFHAMKGRNLGIVVNQSRSQTDIDIGTSMEQICRSYFGLQTDYLGYLNFDDTAWKSLRNRRLVTADFPQCLLSKRIAKVTLNALGVLGFFGGV